MEEEVDEKLHKARLTICSECERFFKPTKTCKECGCFMIVKTRLKNASCPLLKW